jgi:hypothetical protein
VDDQTMHNRMLEALEPEQVSKLAQASKAKLEALLQASAESSSSAAPSTALGPIEAAMQNHPGLTREAAEKMAELLGF